MKRSTERFLTTHTGSLPRPEDLVRAMFAKEEGVPVDRIGLAAKIRAAVAGDYDARLSDFLHARKSHISRLMAKA